MPIQPSRHLFTHLWHTGLLPTIARGVLAVWATPLLLAILATASITIAPTPAQAQAAPQRVIVLDFATAPGIDPVIGRKAADALAVELQNSRNYQVITRQDVEQLIAKTPSLTPPFDEATQSRLGQAAGARSIFSGRIVGVNVQNHRSARIQVEVRQLDVTTADYINGAQVTEVTADKLQDTDNDVLIDEAINKVASTSLRVMRQTPVPEGVVLNVAREEININLGARNGVAPGQRFSVLRDLLNRALSSPGNDVVERVKVAEIAIDKVEADQAIAHATRGRTGVRTGDRVRQIFVPNMAFPVSPNSTVTSSNLPPVQNPTGSSRKSSIGAGIAGIALLALLVVGAGFGGGTSGTNAETSAPTNITAIPVATSSGAPAINLNFSRGIPAIIAGQGVAGYLIYRSTTPNFSIGVGNLHDFVQGSTTSYTDNLTVTDAVTVTISPAANASGDVVFNSTTVNNTVSNSITTSNDVIDINITRTPLLPNTQYFYKVRRITYVSNPNLSSTPTTTTGGTTGGTTGNTTSAFLPRLSDLSASSGGATTLPRPIILSTSGSLTNFSVTVQGTDLVPVAGTTTVGTPQFTNADQFIVEVSSSSNFDQNNRFEQVFNNPGLNATGNLVFNLGSIVVPGFEAGQTVFVRVGARNTTDNPGPTDALTKQPYIFSTTTTISGTTGTLRAVHSRFMANGNAGRSSGGIGLPGSPSGGTGLREGPRRRPAGIMRH
ncbi:MAG: hypothetical protein JO316_19495 [Abitibacteriaceae bacterium]|nr:hypothetical protein [Abditibacteriaceae bacterium]